MAYSDDPVTYSNGGNTRTWGPTGVVENYVPVYNGGGVLQGFAWQQVSKPSVPAPSGAGVSTSTGVNPTETQYSLYGHTVPLSVFGVGRIGGEIISGPWIENGLASFIISFGVPADPSGTRELREIAFDSEVVWQGSLVGDGTPSSSGFSTEPFTVRFYNGTLTQSADALETDHFGADAVAYRPQILLVFENLPLAGTKFGKIPYVAAVIADTSGDDVNLGEAFERLAYSPWVGYTSDQFETVGITDGLVSGGLIIADQAEFLATIQQFGRFYPKWNILQTDKLRIVDRGDDVTPDFIFDKSKLTGQVAFARVEPNSVPGILELSTIDPDADYTIVPSRAQSPRQPVAVTASVKTDSAYLPVIMDAATRISLVTYAKHHEDRARKKVSGSAMGYGFAMEPGDLVALQGLGTDFPGGETFRVLETAHGTNMVVDFTAESILQCDISSLTEPPPTEGGTWVPTFSGVLTNAGQAGWGGITLRQVLNGNLLTTSGTQVRVTFTAAIDAGCEIGSVYIGHQAASGDVFDFDGNQVQLFFGGLPSASISANSSLLSDPAIFTLDATRNLVLAIYFSGTSSIRSIAGASPGSSTWFKTGEDTSTTNASGYSFDTSPSCRCVSKIEVTT